jgi:glyoxylase-like metal-dependent hydrolase (beta-lactamase superfamily II)
MTPRVLPLAIVLSAAGAIRAAAQRLFDLKPIAPNVYLAVAVPRPYVNSNATVVILDDAVLVIDSHSRPSAARALIEEVRRVTTKPIRYVVNSHFHWDHAQGNRAYVGAWPAGTEIISSEATRANLERIGATRIRAEIASLPDSVKALEARVRAAAPGERTALEARLADTRAYLEELRSMELTLPTLTFDRSLVLRRGGTVVYLLFLGRGHTDGDVVGYLPRERVVATGDLVHCWSPYMGDSYPFDWVRTLEELEKLDFDVMLPGHCDAIKGKETIRLWRDFITALLDETARAIGDGLGLQQVIDRVAAVLRSGFAARFPPGALDDVAVSIRKAWSVIAFQSEE